MAKFGVPETVLSDNSKTFILGSTVLESLWENCCQDKNILTYFSNQKIVWNFIAEKAPWQGGMYERLVKSVKGPLKTAIGRKYIGDDEFKTLITEVENIVNSRPLTYVDEGSLEILRPCDLIGSNPSWVITEQEGESENDPDYEQTTVSPREGLIRLCKSEWRRLNRFWDLWNNQYLNLLRETQNLYHKNSNGICRVPMVDEIVLVEDDQSPRIMWRLAIIEERYPDSNGDIRTVMIRYSNGNRTRRPINALYPLELNIEGPRECCDCANSN